MTAYHRFFDTALTRLDPERAHGLAFRAIRAGRPVASRVVPRAVPRPQRAPVEVMGLSFPHAFGLAAGFDKDARGVDALAALGFGHVEVGTVTGEPQPGNPRPRLFRLTADRAIVNRMGFNNDGAEVVARRLADRWWRRSGGPVVGVNIGKSRVVPEDDTDAVLRDHEKSVGLLAPYADYLVVNVSSPNTPGLRDLQATERLEPLLRAVRRRAGDVAGHHVPLVVKIAPDLADEDVLAVADLALASGLDGIIAANTTIRRDGLTTAAAEVERIGPGGLSGPPLAARGLEVVRLLRRHVGDRLAVIGVGGITTAEDARARLAAGADLVQAYTGFVYEGPLWPARVIRDLDPEAT